MRPFLLLSAKRAGTEGAGGITIDAFFAIPDDDCIAVWRAGTEGAGGTATGVFFAMTGAGADCVAA
jgi:hypothetical protein